MFDIYAQLKSELDDFDKNTVKIASVSKSDVRYLGSEKGGYEFSQKDAVNLIELYHNSKFESGETDAEGQRKIFLNIVRFRQEVAEKQTDIDVKDFLFVPEEDTDEYPAFFMGKKFRLWAKKYGFGKVINQLNHDFSKFGSCVAKSCGGTIERTPISTLKNQQDAKSLEESSYVIEEHKDMTLAEMQEYSEWNIGQLDIPWDWKGTVYERYGRVPLSWFKEQTGEKVLDGDEKLSIDTMAILTLQEVKQGEKPTGNLLFIEKIDERPYREAHWTRVDGRWLGIGEVEKNFEHQIFRNMVTNMRRRGLLWASKKIFQSSDTEIGQNLVRDVKDGEVIKVMPNGQISQVNMQTQGLAEFDDAAKEIDANADKTSFTFDVATGESMPSGTPFRLGVILSQAVATYFSLKKEEFGMFMEDIVFDLLLPIFQKENRNEHMLSFSATEEGINKLKDDIISLHVRNIALQKILKGEVVDINQIHSEVEKQINNRSTHWLDFPKGFYDDIKTSVALVTTGENMNIEKRIETLTNLYTSLSQQQDPRAEKVLSKILSLTGENLDSIIGMQASKMTQNPAMAMLGQGGGQAGPQPSPQGTQGAQGAQGAPQAPQPAPALA